MKGGDKHVVVDWSGEVTGGGEKKNFHWTTEKLLHLLHFHMAETRAAQLALSCRM